MRGIDAQLRRIYARLNLPQAVAAWLAAGILGLLLHWVLVHFWPEARIAGRIVLAVVMFAYGSWLLRLRPDPRRTDRRLGLRDRLATWTALSKQDSAAARWLAEDLESTLREVPAERVGALRRGPLCRALLALACLLFLITWADPLGFYLDLPSSTGSASAEPDRPSRKGQRPRDGEQEQAAKPEGGAQEEQKGEEGQEQEPEIPKPIQPEQQEPDAPPGPPPPLDPPLPIPDLGVQEEFVVPRFIGEDDAPGRKERKKVAVVEEGETPPPPIQRLQQSGLVDPEALEDAEFQQALEQTLRARQIPAAERDIVRRYFEALAKARK